MHIIKRRIKRISRVPIYHTRWKHWALYNDTSNTHTHTHTHACTHTLDEEMGTAVKNSLEIIIEHVQL